LEELKKERVTLKTKCQTANDRRGEIKKEMAPFQHKMKEQDVLIRKLTE